jgi:2',3'-cyclic-nucleotide 2'-phosphodiesterase/3'-nucleotidase
LAHSGFGANVGPDEAAPMAENATIAVSRIAGIDAVVAGHTHELFPHPGPNRRPDRCGCPTVMPGWEGSHVGVIDLTLAPATPGGWRVASSRCRVVAGERDAAGRRCATIVAAVAGDHRAVRRNLHRIVGETRDRISTHFALAGDSSAAGLVAQACLAEAERMAAGTPYSGLPVLAASAPFLCGGRAGPDSYTDIPEGPLRMHHLCELSPYPNRLDVMTISGAGLRDWLEMSARVFATLTPGRTDQPLVAGVTPGYLFDVIAGATYRIDPSANPLFSVSGRRSGGGPGRIRDLRVAGRPVRDSDRFLLAASTFRVSGGGRFPGTGAGKSVLRSDGSIRDILARELCRRTAPVCAVEPIWRFVDLPGTSAILATAPAAAARTGDAGRVPLGLNDKGFLQVRIAL